MIVNLATHVLNEIDTDWNTANYDPKPALINQNDSSFHANPPAGYSAGDRTVDFDHTQANVVKVGSNIARDSTPIGAAFDYNIEDGVTVIVQAAHQSEFGNVADHDEFLSLVSEVRRTLSNDRVWPIRNTSGDEHYYTLRFGQENDNSNRYSDFYEYNLPVLFIGREDLP